MSTPAGYHQNFLPLDSGTMRAFYFSTNSALSHGSFLRMYVNFVPLRVSESDKRNGMGILLSARFDWLKQLI
jgi:hypothetical protein